MTSSIRRAHHTLPGTHFSRTRLQTLIGLFCFASLGVLHGEPASDLIALKVAPGFVAEEVLAAGAEDGSWSAMAVDPRGRLVISPQGSEPMLRVTFSAEGKDGVEKLVVPVTSAMGLLFAFDSFYVNGMGPQGFGLYRLRDTKGADVFDDVKLLRKFEGGVFTEHGSHGLALGSDGRIYLAQGNHVAPPADALPTSPFKNYAEDQLLPSANYGLSGGDKGKAPSGYILRMDGDGREVELFAGGFRNVYDLAFDACGELFVFDSDTEFSWGQPWYVPTRILHVVSGGDYGFREGTGKWPAHFPDSLPPVVNVGLGSPTGVKFCTASRFPEQYRRALFALDWTFGRILAVHLDARGASFAGRFETFLQGRPLNLTDMEFGQDGAMYFITGGRKTRSALYRVRYTGDEVKEPTSIAVEHEVEERRALESLHGKAEAQTVSKAWPGLGSEDRFVRHAARIALESQPVAQWSARALSEKEPRTSLTVLLSLARLGSNAERAAVVAHVANVWRQLSYETLQLDAPRIVPRTLALLQAATTLEEQLHYVFHLRHQRTGWSTEERATYFRWFTQPHPASAHPPEVKQWFADVRLHYADGGSLTTYLTNIRNEAAATLTDADRKELASLLEAPLLSTTQPVAVKPHQFVKAWLADDLLPAVGTLAQPRSIESGREVFTAAACIACHRYANEGGAIGPDLTTVAYKLGAREILESLIDPSKVISDQFQNTIVELTNGETRTGRIIERGKDSIAISINPMGGDREEIPKSRIRAMKPSPLSQMPPDLLNMLTSDEVLDLLAYLGFGRP
jgi:putative heme-binding domain-containing protein